MYYVWEDNAHIPLERNKLAQAIMQTYLPGWTADLTESARPHWPLTTSERLPDPPATREDIFVQHLISLTQEHMA